VQRRRGDMLVVIIMASGDKPRMGRHVNFKSLKILRILMRCLCKPRLRNNMSLPRKLTMSQCLCTTTYMPPLPVLYHKVSKTTAFYIAKTGSRKLNSTSKKAFGLIWIQCLIIRYKFITLCFCFKPMGLAVW